MLVRTSSNLTISLMYNLVSFSNDYIMLMGKMLVDFVGLSTITHVELNF